jgi:nitronate monooxygenase
LILDSLDTPIVLAPLAGGPSTPELAAAVSDAGGLGFLAAGYLDAPELARRRGRLRELTRRPYGVNVFAPGADAADPAGYGDFVERLEGWAAERELPLGQPRHDDDGFDAKLELLLADPPPVVSFTFGCPSAGIVERLHGAGSEVWVTVTTAEEVDQAQAAGIDALVVQGAEAGGHRGSFVDREDLPLVGLLSLLQLAGARSHLPLIAAGGIATGAAVAAVLAAGAVAAQVGTAFMRCPEAGTSDVHRDALAGDAPTAMTRAFSGRLARGIRNTFLDTFSVGAPIAYPELHHVTAPLRRRSRETGHGEFVNLWAGETHALARAEPAAEVVRRLSLEARAALARAGKRLA